MHSKKYFYDHIPRKIVSDIFSMNCKQTADLNMKYSASYEMDIST